MLAHLADADGGRGRFLATTIDAMTGSTVDQLYVHAKIGIVDDRWLTIGSANINAHSFFNDTEVNVQIYDHALARATRLRLWSEHLGVPADEIAGDPTDVVDRLWTRDPHEDVARDGALGREPLVDPGHAAARMRTGSGLPLGDPQ